MLQVHRCKRIVLLFTRTSKVVKIAFQNVESHNSALLHALYVSVSVQNCFWVEAGGIAELTRRIGRLGRFHRVRRDGKEAGCCLSRLVQLACLRVKGGCCHRVLSLISSSLLHASLSLATGSGFCHCCLALCLFLVMFAFLCMHVCFQRLGFQ